MATERARKTAGAHVESGRVVTVRVEKVVAEGDGLGRLDDGRVVFVEGALPGELVEARIVKQSRDYARATTTKVIEANPERVDPPCRFVDAGCGGCDLQHASVSLQRAIKRDIVHESLVRLGRIVDPDVRIPDVEVPVEGGRTTIRVARANNGHVGFRRRRSHDVVPVDRCLIAHPGLGSVFADLRLESAEEAVVRVSDHDGAVVVWAEPAGMLGLDSGSVVAQGPKATIVEVVKGVALRVRAASFFQSSPRAAEVLVERVSVALGSVESWGTGPLLDAYGGIGLFAATIDVGDREVVVVEANPSACADARHNLRDRRARVVETAMEQWVPEPCGVVVADPARDGLRAAGVDALVATGASIIVLVSCDPASLGRDARLLMEAGYRFEYCEVLDLFPHTHHVEAVSRFVRDGILDTL
jgi:23S rRNA (uracil1939-C5)-methyltransferase